MDTFFVPTDPCDPKLVDDIFPANWKNPAPATVYDLLVAGGGPAGIGLVPISHAIHPFPTQSEGIRAATETALTRNKAAERDYEKQSY
jgi:hypothetical protein